MNAPITTLNIAKRLKALAQTGINFNNNAFDVERYEEILRLADQLMAQETGLSPARLKAVHAGESSYITPKVDVRTVLTEGKKILLVQEAADHRWALPGGWADVGFPPSKVAVKEVKEETGLDIAIDQLLAVFDNSLHGHPPSPFYVYKMFFSGDITGGSLDDRGHEVLDARFFDIETLPPLSEERNTESQVRRLFKMAKAKNGTTTAFD